MNNNEMTEKNNKTSDTERSGQTTSFSKDNTKTVTTSKESSTPEFVLRTIEVPLISYKKITKNRTLYPEEALTKGFNHPITKELIKMKKFYMEGDHPNVELEKRIKTKLGSPIVGNITRVFKNEDTGHFHGEVDIFDNKMGNLVANLLDYGSVLGVSIRAEADSETKVGSDGQPYEEITCNDNFIIHGFDIVISPSSSDALITKQSSPKLESVMDNGGVKFLSTAEGVEYKKLLFEEFSTDSTEYSDNTIKSLSDFDFNSLESDQTKTIYDDNSHGVSSNSYKFEDEDELLKESLDLYHQFGTIKEDKVEMGSNKTNIQLKESSTLYDDEDIFDNGQYSDNEDDEKEIIMESIKDLYTDRKGLVNDDEKDDIIDIQGIIIDNLIYLLGITEDSFEDLDELLEITEELIEEELENDEDKYALDKTGHTPVAERSRTLSRKSKSSNKFLEDSNYVKVIKYHRNPLVSTDEDIFAKLGYKL